MTRTLRIIRSRWGWLAICLIAGMLLSLTRGLDNWWDLLNYHIYNPWALLHHRENVDLFAAGIQGYFDPLLDIPYYLIAFVWFPNHPAIVAALTGLPFGLLLFVTLLLVRNVLAPLTASMNPVARWTITLITLVMAVSGVSTWSQAFTTTNEVMVSAIVLGALVLLIGAFAAGPHYRHLSVRRAFAVGCLLGLAAGLKLTATVYAPAGGLLLLATCRDRRSLILFSLTFFAGWMFAFAAVYGPWAIHLYRQTGNPFFPMFNNFFHSSLIIADSGRDIRFLPLTISEWLFAPFYWLNDHTQTVFPLLFRDVRFALVFVLGLPAAIAALVPWRKSLAPRSQALFAITFFWVFAYATWLNVFSMLRYAIVLEISASIIAVASLLYMARRFSRALPQYIQTSLVSGLIVATIWFARIPDLGHIPIEKHAFETDVPRLGNHSLVILASEPMGLLAPEIWQRAPETSFIGIPPCFARSQWCYASFYHYNLGVRMRQMIAKHRGPIYVAFYTDSIPSLSQLATFHIKIDLTSCQSVYNNRTPPIRLCAAHYSSSFKKSPIAALKFRLATNTVLRDPHFQLKHDWLKNPCSATQTLGQLTFTWRAPPSAKDVHIFLQPPPTYQRIPFTGGGLTGQAQTGKWVKATQIFLFVDRRGRELARSVISYRECSSEH